MYVLSNLFVIRFAEGMPSFPPDKEYIIPMEKLIETVQLQKDYVHQYIESVRQLYVDEEKIITRIGNTHVGDNVLIHGFYSSGDQVWYTAFLREWGKLASVHFGVMGLKNSAGIWDGNKAVSDLQFPLDKEIFDSYDHIADLRAITPPFDKEDDRSHVRRYCESFGIPWTPECDKPEIHIEPKEKALFFVDKLGDSQWGFVPYYIIQMHGQAGTHSFTPEQLRGIAERLDAPAFFVGFREQGEVLWQRMDIFKPEEFDFYPCIYGSELKGNTSLTVRELLVLVSKAKAVICPDSFLQHAAAAFDVPCVTVYGTHNPERLSANYPHNTAIYHKEVCILSPCGGGVNGQPADCPTKAFGICGVVVSVKSEEIMEKLNGLG